MIEICDSSFNRHYVIALKNGAHEFFCSVECEEYICDWFSLLAIEMKYLDLCVSNKLKYIVWYIVFSGLSVETWTERGCSSAGGSWVKDVCSSVLVSAASSSRFFLSWASWNIRTPHQILHAQPMMIQASPNWIIPVMKTAQSHPSYSTSVHEAITVPRPRWNRKKRRYLEWHSSRWDMLVMMRVLLGGFSKNLHFGEVRLSALLTCVEEKKLHELKLYPRMGDIDGTNNLLI